MSYRIPKPDGKCLEVYIGDRKTPKRVPLMSCLPVKWVLKANAIRRTAGDDQEAAGMLWFEFACQMFADYIGQETVDRMTAEQINALFEAWNAENEEQDGTGAGE